MVVTGNNLLLLDSILLPGEVDKIPIICYPFLSGNLRILNKIQAERSGVVKRQVKELLLGVFLFYRSNLTER